IAATERRVYVLGDESIDERPGVIGFGVSPDRRLFAKLEEGAVHIDEGWDGKRRTTLKLPKRIWGSGQRVLRPFPDGERGLLSSEAGVFVVSKDGPTRLLPENDEDDSLSYPHAAMSHDGSVIAFGCQDSAHLLNRWNGSAFARCAEISPASE